MQTRKKKTLGWLTSAILLASFAEGNEQHTTEHQNERKVTERDLGRDRCFK